MIRVWISIAALLIAGGFPCLAGVIYVHDGFNDSGTWYTGDSIFVEGYTIIDDDESLHIEPGVAITIGVADSFIIEGNFVASGSDDNPIHLWPISEWKGFFFKGDSNPYKILNYVVIPPEATVPAGVIKVDDAPVAVSNCQLTGRNYCLNFNGGRIRAESNKLICTGIHSHVVMLDNLIHSAENILKNNVIIASVESGSVTDQRTYGLYLDRFTQLECTNNDIHVQAPGPVEGVYLGDIVSGNASDLQLLRCVITAMSTHNSGHAIGVRNINLGDMDVRHCVIDIRTDTESPDINNHLVGCYSGQSAYITVNSSDITLGNGQRFFGTQEGGQINVDYATLWSTVTETIRSIGDPESPNDFRMDVFFGGDNGAPTDPVEIGNHVYMADPLRAEVGTWGSWTSPRMSIEASHEAFHNWYTILENSPCRDTGDPDNTPDPDGSLPDIGCFYFNPGTIDNAPPPVELPKTVSIGCAYPNPFNPMTSIPLDLSAAARIQMKVYNMQGQLVQHSREGFMPTGHHVLPFTAHGLSTGVYIASILVNGEPTHNQKLILVK